MIYGGDAHEVCPHCKQSLSVKDWTCPKCGAILDRYLFGTVTEKSVTGADKEAFWAGYGACETKWNQSYSLELGDYVPIAGHETAYRAGWERATVKLKSKVNRKAGRRRGLQLIGVGTISLLFGGGVMAASSAASGGRVTLLPVAFLGSGVIALVLGIVMLISGISDQ